MFNMYEAVREDEHPKAPKLFPDEDNADDEDIMCNFIPMVKEYLTRKYFMDAKVVRANR